jgi:hypothetical protein
MLDGEGGHAGTDDEAGETDEPDDPGHTGSDA